MTRGDCNLTPILDTLPYDDIVVYDNSLEPDLKTFGRYTAIRRAKHPIIYSQDDDIILTAHDELLNLYEPGLLIANMPSPWYERTGYDTIRQAFLGAGSLFHRDLLFPAIDRYLADWPADLIFHQYVDVITGLLTPHKRYDLGYTILPNASEPGRLCTTPGGQERKHEMQKRAMTIRETGWLP